MILPIWWWCCNANADIDECSDASNLVVVLLIFIADDTSNLVVVLLMSVLLLSAGLFLLTSLPRLS